MIINVTQEDINKGERCSGYNCPIAIAIERHTNAASVFVGTAICINHKVINYDNLEITTFIDNYDRFKHVEPFSFELPYGKEKTK